MDSCVVTLAEYIRVIRIKKVYNELIHILNFGWPRGDLKTYPKGAKLL
jgi:hypothetical protein